MSIRTHFSGGSWSIGGHTLLKIMIFSASSNPQKRQHSSLYKLYFCIKMKRDNRDEKQVKQGIPNPIPIIFFV